MTTCKSAGRGNPRTLPGRHGSLCPAKPGGPAEGDERDCPGCLPCPNRHCTVCQRVHTDGACPECVAATRDDLATIRLICGLVPSEAIRKGVNGEAMMLWGPAANAEAWGNRHMSALRGRLCKCQKLCPAHFDRMCPDAAAYLADARDETHPLYTHGAWENVWRDTLNQPSDLRQTVTRAIDYIERHIHEMATKEEPDFAQFATEVRSCHAHLRAVIHDENQGDPANVGCFECGARLERKLRDRRPGGPNDDRGGFDNHWTCTRCRRTYTHAEYHIALRAALETQQEETA